MINPMISVVLPVYNGEKYLQEAIESILNQTCSDFELIVINDGSTDNSLSIIKSYAVQDSRINVINRENHGLIASLNEGFELAQGKYIARMDADDISLPSRFEKQILLMEDKKLDICGCHFSFINRYGQFLDTIFCPLNNSSLLLYLSFSVPFAHGSVMIRKSFLNEHKLKYGQKVSFAEDKALWIQMYESGARFNNVNEILFYYREFPESLSKIKMKHLNKDEKQLRINFLNQHLDLVLQETQKLSKDIEKLSYRELELLADLSITAFFQYKKIQFWKIFKKLPYRYKVIAIFKWLSKV